MGLRIIPVDLFQRFGYTSVKPYSLGEGQFLGESFLNQGVSELVPTYGQRQIFDDPGRQSLLQHSKQSASDISSTRGSNCPSSNSRSMTDAMVRVSLHRWLNRFSLRPMTVRNPSGMRTVQESRFPDLSAVSSHNRTSSRTTSVTKRGFP